MATELGAPKSEARKDHDFPKPKPLVLHPTNEGIVKATKVFSDRPKITWCMLVAVLLALVIAIGVTMFYMPGRGAPVEQRSTTPASSQ